MVHFNKALIYVVMLLSSSTCLLAKTKQEGQKVDPIVGSYAINETIDGVNLFANATFFADHNLIFNDSAAAQQPTLGCPNGCYGTLTQGRWKKIDKRRYQIVMNLVLIMKDTTTRNECGDLLLAGIATTPPSYRIKFDGEIILSDDCQTITTTTLVASFFALPDISFSTLLFADPSLSFTGDRLRFPL